MDDFSNVLPDPTCDARALEIFERELRAVLENEIVPRASGTIVMPPHVVEELRQLGAIDDRGFFRPDFAAQDLAR